MKKSLRNTYITFKLDHFSRSQKLYLYLLVPMIDLQAM